MLERAAGSDASEDRHGNRLRIAILMKNAGFLRCIQTEVQALCDRGHAIHFAVEDFPVEDEGGLLAELCARSPSVSVGQAVARRDQWVQAAASLRGVLDYCRSLHPDHRRAIGLSECADIEGSPLALRIGRAARRLRIDRSARSAGFLLRLLRSLYGAIPPDPGILTYLRQLDLDLLLTADGVWPRSVQADYILACRPLGIPTGDVVNERGNLTDKGDVKADAIERQARATVSRRHDFSLLWRPVLVAMRLAGTFRGGKIPLR